MKQKLLFHFFFLSVAFYSVNLKAQTRKIDSLIKIVETTKSDTIRLINLNQVSFMLGTIDLDKAYKYGKQAIEVAIRGKFGKGLCHAYNNMGIIFDQRGQGDSAMLCYDKSYEMSRKIGNIYLEASSLGNIGYLYWNKGDYKNALDYSFQALAILDTGTNYTSIAAIIEHIAMIYYDVKDYKNSIKFHGEAIKFYEKANDEGDIAGVYSNLSLNYLESNKDSVIFYLKKAETIFIKYHEHWGLGHVYNNIGGLYVEMKKPDEALIYLTKARNQNKLVSDDRALCATYMSTGMAWLFKDQTKTAKKFVDTSIALCIKFDQKEDLAKAYHGYALIYSRLGVLDSVTKYLEKETTLRDTIFSSEKAKAMVDMQTKYQTEKKELEHKTEIALKEEEVFKRNIIIASVIIFVIIGGWIAYLFYRKKQADQEAKLAAEISTQKEIRTKAIIEAEEKERRRIAQDLHDGIGQILSAAKLNLSSLESTMTNETESQRFALKNTLDLIDDSVREVRTVSHSMMPNTLIKLGLASAIKEFITKIGSLPNLKVDLEIVGLDHRLEENAETALYRAIQEIVNNIIKHAKANKIGIQIIRHENELSIVIEDNGVGFDVQKINEFGGIGLKNILSRIEFINGTVHFDSIPGRGTTVIMEVPLV